MTTPEQKYAIGKLLGVNAEDANAYQAGRLASDLSPLKTAKISLPIVAATTVNDTGFDLPTRGVVLHAMVDVSTAEATGTTKTIDVGLLASETGGDEDGFIDGISAAAIAKLSGTVTATDGTNQNYFAAAPTLGALLRVGDLGGDAAGTSAALISRPHVLNGTAKSVTYTLGAANFAEMVATLYITYYDYTIF